MYWYIDISYIDISIYVAQIIIASVHLQILELCDEFVPGDPPEYFFDRYCIYYPYFAAGQISTKPYGKCIGPWGLGRVGFLLTKCFPSTFLWIKIKRQSRTMWSRFCTTLLVLGKFLFLLLLTRRNLDQFLANLRFQICTMLIVFHLTGIQTTSQLF